MQVAAGKLEREMLMRTLSMRGPRTSYLSVTTKHIYNLEESKSCSIFRPDSLSAFVRETLSEAEFLFVTEYFRLLSPQTTERKIPTYLKRSCNFAAKSQRLNMQLRDVFVSMFTCGFNLNNVLLLNGSMTYLMSLNEPSNCGCSWVWLKFPRVGVPLWALLRPD